MATLTTSFRGSPSPRSAKKSPWTTIQFSDFCSPGATPTSSQSSSKQDVALNQLDERKRNALGKRFSQPSFFSKRAEPQQPEFTLDLTVVTLQNPPPQPFCLELLHDVIRATRGLPLSTSTTFLHELQCPHNRCYAAVWQLRHWTEQIRQLDSHLWTLLSCSAAFTRTFPNAGGVTGNRLSIEHNGLSRAVETPLYSYDVETEGVHTFGTTSSATDYKKRRDELLDCLEKFGRQPENLRSELLTRITSSLDVENARHLSRLLRQLLLAGGSRDSVTSSPGSVQFSSAARSVALRTPYSSTIERFVKTLLHLTDSHVLLTFLQLELLSYLRTQLTVLRDLSYQVDPASSLCQLTAASSITRLLSFCHALPFSESSSTVTQIDSDLIGRNFEDFLSLLSCLAPPTSLATNVGGETSDLLRDDSFTVPPSTPAACEEELCVDWLLQEYLGQLPAPVSHSLMTSHSLETGRLLQGRVGAPDCTCLSCLLQLRLSELRSQLVLPSPGVTLPHPVTALRCPPGEAWRLLPSLCHLRAACIAPAQGTTPVSSPRRRVTATLDVPFSSSGRRSRVDAVLAAFTQLQRASVRQTLDLFTQQLFSRAVAACRQELASWVGAERDTATLVTKLTPLCRSRLPLRDIETAVAAFFSDEEDFRDCFLLLATEGAASRLQHWLLQQLPRVVERQQVLSRDRDDAEVQIVVTTQIVG